MLGRFFKSLWARSSVVRPEGDCRALVEGLESRTLLSGDLSTASVQWLVSSPALAKPALHATASPAARRSGRRAAAAPTAPYQLTATTISPTQIKLTWRDGNRNRLNFYIERSTNGKDFRARSRVAGTLLQFTDTGLAPKTRYWYRIRVRTAAGYSPYSAVDNARTSDPRISPAIPSNLTATATSYTQVRVSWRDTSNNETAFILERSTNSTDFQQAATTAAQQTSYLDRGLLPGTTYYYRLCSRSAGGTSDYTPIVSVTTPNLPPAPSSPVNLAAVPADASPYSQIRLTWQETSTNETGFIVERSLDASHWQQMTTTSAHITTWLDKGLTASTTYYYRVSARNVGGVSDPSNVANATTAALPDPPNPPSDLVALTKSTARIDLSWHDNSSNETGFTIERSTDGTHFVYLTRTSAGVKAYSNLGLTAGTTYYYRICATGVGGNSAYCIPVHATTATGAVAPNAPSKLVAAAQDPTHIRLTWQDNSTNESGFEVERSLDGTNFTLLTTTAASRTTFTDQGLTPNTTYYYRVRARSISGFSSYAGPVNVTTPAISGTPAAPTNLVAALVLGSDTQIKLTWLDRSDNETGFIVERSVDNSHFQQVTQMSANQSQYIDMGLDRGATYYYRVCSRNAAGSSAYVTASATTPAPTGGPAAPGNLQAMISSASQIQLNWDDHSTNEAKFVVQRSIDGITFTNIADVAANRTTYTDKELTAGTTYFYRVAASNLNGGSPWSNVVSITL